MVAMQGAHLSCLFYQHHHQQMKAWVDPWEGSGNRSCVLASLLLFVPECCHSPNPLGTEVNHCGLLINVKSKLSSSYYIFLLFVIVNLCASLVGPPPFRWSNCFITIDVLTHLNGHVHYCNTPYLTNCELCCIFWNNRRIELNELESSEPVVRLSHLHNAKSHLRPHFVCDLFVLTSVPKNVCWMFKVKEVRSRRRKAQTRAPNCRNVTMIRRRKANQRLLTSKMTTHNKVFRLENQIVKIARLLMTSVMMESRRSNRKHSKTPNRDLHQVMRTVTPFQTVILPPAAIEILVYIVLTI